MSVGVAYGSDTKLVYQTLQEIARRNSLVQRVPAPEVVFKSFGDSTLDFELRVVIPGRPYLPRVQHELNMAIDEAFREKKIEIAFPQRDVHIHNVAQASAAAVEVEAEGASEQVEPQAKAA